MASGVQDAEEAKAKLAAVSASIGRDITVFMRPAAVPSTQSADPRSDSEDIPDSFYEFTAADYATLQAGKKEDTQLKTKKHRDAEAAARRARITKATLRFQFPDNLIVEAEFKASDRISVVIDFLRKVILRPQLPFFLYTTPPKIRINDLQKTLYDAGLAPSALVYFSHEAAKGATAVEVQAAATGPFLKPEISELRDLHLVSGQKVQAEPSPAEQVKPESTEQGDTPAATAAAPTESKAGGGKLPKWFKR